MVVESNIAKKIASQMTSEGSQRAKESELMDLSDHSQAGSEVLTDGNTSDESNDQITSDFVDAAADDVTDEVENNEGQPNVRNLY